jgi:transmembrane protein TMEM174 (potassium channel)
MPAARKHEVTRVEGFSDAVFAFALTLLVVSLDVPRGYDDLMKLMGGFVPFTCSFALLVWIWYEHNVFFRKFGMQDPYTVALNAVLLFVVLFYVYPLKFLFTAAFSFFIPALGLPRPHILPAQLGRIFAIYGAGFVVLFLMFGLLYLHAYRKRDVLGLSALEVFDVRVSGGEHLVSASVGAIATLIALIAPHPYPGFSGFTYFLMGPAHWIYGVKAGKRRRALEQQLTQSSVAAV